MAEAIPESTALKTVLNKLKECDELEFLGWYNDKYIGCKTRLILQCKCCKTVRKTTTLTTLPKLIGVCRACSYKAVSDRSKDSFVGKSRSVRNSTHTIVSQDRNKFVYYHCSSCSDDSELFPKGIFRQCKSDWNAGKCSCACATNLRWSKDQYRILCERKCSSLEDREFIDFCGEWKGHRTKIIQRCRIHGDWDTSTIDKLLHSERGCPSCARDGSFFGYYPHKAFDEDTLYLIKFYKDNELFIKVGRSFDLNNRLDDFIKYSGYEIKLLSTTKDIHKNIYRLEQDLHLLMNEHHYRPLMKFGGSKYECFKEEILNNKYITNIFKYGVDSDVT